MCQTCLTSDLINEQEYSNITNTIQCDTTLDRKLSTVYKKKTYCIAFPLKQHGWSTTTSGWQFVKWVNWSPVHPIHLNACFWTTPKEQWIRRVLQPTVTLSTRLNPSVVNGAKVKTALFRFLIKPCAAHLSILSSSLWIIAAYTRPNTNVLVWRRTVYASYCQVVQALKSYRLGERA